MAAPSGISWSSTQGSYYRLGIHVSLSNTNTQTTVTIQTWLWSKWSLSDSNNGYYFNNNATSASTWISSSVNFSHSVSTGSGWSTSNQTKVYTHTYTYNRTTSAQTIYCAAKLTSIGSNDSTVTHSTSYTIPALASYTVTYNANGGSGAPSAQTKWYDKTLTLSSTKPTRTGYSFLGWSTSSTATTASYSAGGSYTANAATTLYAVWKANTYTVTYNANGGSGAPSAQTKTYGVTLTLSSTKPTRTNYNFKGWGTSASATTVSYAAGASYTTNAAITLYAVWELAYSKPRITGISLYRTNSGGTSSETGTYFRIAFSWATDKTVSSVTVKWKASTATSWSSSSITASGTSGNVSQVLGGGNVSTEASYDVQIIVSDASGSTTINRILPGIAYAIDFLKGGKGVAIGKPAEKAGFDIGMNTTVTGYLTSSTVKGTNTIASTANDTVDNWVLQGNSIHYYNTSGLLTNQPNQYGFLLNITKGATEIHQVWFGQAYGNMLHRGGNAGGWGGSGAWKTLLDSGNYSSYALPLTGGTVSGYTKLSNSVNAIGWLRAHNDWLGFYANAANAQGNTSRKGWVGFDGGSNFQFMNNSSGSNITNVAWTTSSDERLKTEIEDISSDLVNVWRELLPKTFKWNELNSTNHKMQFGLIAQDVIAAFEKYDLDYRDYGFVVPYTMPDSDTEYFSITYDSYHMLTAMVLRETNNELADLKTQLKDLRSVVETLAKKFEEE